MSTQSDLIDISPKQKFIKSQKDPGEWRSVAGMDIVERACEATLAQMVLSGATRDQLNGAVMFMHNFLNLGEPQVAQKTFPVKTLQAQ